MKALILAAGLGTRLAPLTNAMPKSLVQVNGRPILLNQIRSLTENGVRDITVVSGYKADVLSAAVHAGYPHVHIIENTEYADTNNMYSAYLARDRMRGSSFIMMNADVFFDASVIQALLAYPAENAIVTDIGTYLEESMKVVQQDGRLVHISKTVDRQTALGASIDVYKFSPAGGDAFFAKCAEYICQRQERKLWSEVALNDILPAVPFQACPLQGRWLEIDDLNDLRAAEALFA